MGKLFPSAPYAVMLLKGYCNEAYDSVMPAQSNSYTITWLFFWTTIYQMALMAKIFKGHVIK